MEKKIVQKNHTGIIMKIYVHVHMYTDERFIAMNTTAHMVG